MDECQPICSGIFKRTGEPGLFYTHIDKELKGNCRLVKIYQGTTLQGHALAVIDGRILSDGCILEESRISAGTGPFFCHGTDHQTGYPTADRKNRYGTDLIFTQDRLRRANDSALHVYAMPAQRPYRNYRPALWDLQQNRFHCKQESVQGDGNVRHINQRPWATGHPGWCAFLCRPIGTGVRHF